LLKHACQKVLKIAPFLTFKTENIAFEVGEEGGMAKRLLLNEIFHELRDIVRSYIRFLRVRIKPLMVIATFVLILFMMTQVTSLVLTSKTIPNVGVVKAVGVGVYWDAALTNKVSSIDWGVLDPGSNKNVTVYIRNEGNSAVSLTMNTANWNPSTTSNYMTLTWNYGGQSINVGAVIQVKLTLSVSASVAGITNFSFDINIVASG